MFHYKKNKSFYKKFTNKEIILIGNDVGPMRCFESVGGNFSQNFFRIYVQSRGMSNYIKNISMAFTVDKINLAELMLKIIFCRNCEVIILQSSYVSLLEKLIVKLKGDIYVLQDCKDDYKFGVNVKYLTAFDSTPGEGFWNTEIYVIGALRPKISNHTSQVNLSNALLIIGAKNLLLFNGAIDFFKMLLELSANIGYQVYYKPHPFEELDVYRINLFSSMNVRVVYELPVGDFWPKLIVSPYSSLGYDIPEQVTIRSGGQFKILHSFGEHYDEHIALYPGFKEMVSCKAMNFNLNKISEFFDE